MPAWEYIITPSSGAALTLNTNTEFDEVGSAARLAFWSYQALDGEDGLNLGAVGERGVLRGWMHTSTEALLETAKGQLTTLTKGGLVCSISLRGAAKTWANCVLDGPPKFTDHYRDVDGAVGVKFEVNIRKLVPA